MISYVDLRPRALGVPTPVMISAGAETPGTSPRIINSAFYPLGFDEFNVISGIVFQEGILSDVVFVKVENGVDTPIDSENSVGPPVIPLERGANHYQVRVKVPTTFKPNEEGLYQLTVQGQAGFNDWIITNMKNFETNGSGFVVPYDLVSTWMVADW